MDRTLRAALLAAILTFAVVAGFGLLLGFPPLATIVASAGLALFAGVLIVAAAQRAETFETPTPPTPGFPGAPDRDDGTPSDPTAADTSDDDER